MATLLQQIQATPGLLEKFQRICADDSPSEWLSLSADEKALFERYKEHLTAC